MIDQQSLALIVRVPWESPEHLKKERMARVRRLRERYFNNILSYFNVATLGDITLRQYWTEIEKKIYSEGYD